MSAPPREVRQAQWVFALLAVQFVIPALSYLVQPAVALQTVSTANQLLGGRPYAPVESTGNLWHMLAVGNVMTLGFMCALIAVDPRKYAAVLPALLFLKAHSALLSLGLGLTGSPPFFLGVFVLDGLTCAVMVIFGVRANRAWRQAMVPAAT